MAYGSGNITVNVYLQSIPSISAKFRQVLHLVDLATNSLNGDTYRTYYSYADVDADQALGYVSATTLGAARDFFAQPGSNKVLLLGSVDIVGGDGYDDAMNDCIDAGAEFWAVTINSRTQADMLLVAANCETLGRYMFFYQDDDGTWLTAGYPGAMAAMEGRERSMLCWHDTDTEWSDLCVAGNRMDFDPDVQAVTFSCAVKEVAALATALTSNQESELQLNQGNYGKAWGTATYWFGTGINHGDRPTDHILAIDWWQTRLEGRLSALVQQAAARGEKITVDGRGQGLVLSEIDAQISQGLSAGHFLEVSSTDSDVKTYSEPVTITAADVTAQRLRFKVQLVLSTGVVTLTVNTYARAY